MKFIRHTLAFGLTVVLLFHAGPFAIACGPEPTTPMFSFKTSPELPFTEFAQGKLGIIKPTFGRKTLVIAYRYLNGGSFTAEEQQQLVAALWGKAPEDGDESAAVKAWTATRKEVLKDEQLPSIYTERQYGGYDFFPNCTQNAFEVAAETLKDRIARHGADNNDVKAWLSAQDTVFQNCSAGAQIPVELGAGSPAWLRKDRDYQIAAAHFYSLNFDEARGRFENIAADNESPWQEIAPYLVARTFVRQASLTAEPRKREFYQQAEIQLRRVSMSGGKFAAPAARLLSLVKYHIHPEERVVELGRVLAAGGSDNVRQDLIDYAWLLDNFKQRTINEYEKRHQVTEGVENSPVPEPTVELTAGDEPISITLYKKNPDGTNDYAQFVELKFKHDVPQAEILRGFEQELKRSLTTEETTELKKMQAAALDYRKWRISPNRKWDNGGLSQYQGCADDCSPYPLDLLPEFLRTDDLSDWIFTLQTADRGAYAYALSKWQQNDSRAWLVTALAKAEKTSPKVAELMRAAAKVTSSEAAYPTVVYHLIRLHAELGQTTEARKLLDGVISESMSELPVSAQNQFLVQRRRLSRGLEEFLKSAQQKPIAFYNYGSIGKIRDLIEIQKSRYDPEISEQSKEEYDAGIDEDYKDWLPWDERVAFDDSTIDTLNWYFPLSLLVETSRNPNVPDYLQRNLTLAAWTRAILLKDDKVALELAPAVVKAAPGMATVFQRYLKARTPKQRQTAALYVLLKEPTLSPFVNGALPETHSTSEELEYYFETSWWCPLPETDYDEKGNEIPKVVFTPAFLSARELEAARQERAALKLTGDAKSYLGKQVLEWARIAPADPRIPEALFIAARANESYKFGCDSWTSDEETKAKAEAMLRQRYPRSPWTAKLSEYEREN